MAEDKMGPKNERDFEAQMQAVYDLFLKKNAEYGAAYYDYGLMGRVSRIGERGKRLRKLVWERYPAPIDKEQARANLEDLAVEAIISIMCLDDDNIAGIF